MTTTPPAFETLQYAVQNGIATISLHRPEKMNAFTHQMCEDLIAAFDATDADDNVRAVVVTGSGRAFCAGADLSSGGATFDYEKRYGSTGVKRDGGGRVVLRIFRSLKPVIAAVNGAAVGVGVTMQLPMDIRIASTDAKFGLVFARRGLRRKRLRHGSCRASWGFRRHWNGVFRVACSARRKRTSADSCVRSMRPRICCRRPMPSPGRSRTTPPRFRSPWRAR
jgi:hypothetical protein